MPEQDADLAGALGPGGAHVVLVGLLQEQGAVPARAGADARYHAHQHRQDQELPGLEIGVEAGDGHQHPLLGHQVLAADDIEQVGDGHQGNEDEHRPAIQRGAVKHHHHQRHADIHPDADRETGQGDRQAGPHAGGDIGGDIAAALGAAEVKGEQLDRLGVEDGLGERRQSVSLVIDEQRLVITVLALPVRDRLRRHVLLAQLGHRHVIRGIHHEKQGESQQVDPDQNGNGVQQASDYVGKHQLSPALRTVAFWRRR